MTYRVEENISLKNISLNGSYKTNANIGIADLAWIYLIYPSILYHILEIPCANLVYYALYQLLSICHNIL